MSPRGENAFLLSLRSLHALLAFELFVSETVLAHTRTHTHTHTHPHAGPGNCLRLPWTARAQCGKCKSAPPLSVLMSMCLWVKRERREGGTENRRKERSHSGEKDCVEYYCRVTFLFHSSIFSHGAHFYDIFRLLQVPVLAKTAPMIATAMTTAARPRMVSCAGQVIVRGCTQHARHTPQGAHCVAAHTKTLLCTSIYPCTHIPMDSLYLCWRAVLGSRPSYPPFLAHFAMPIESQHSCCTHSLWANFGYTI